MDSGMGELRDLLPRVLPQVAPCPPSVALDALQAAAVEFCAATGVWADRIDEVLPAGECLLRADAPRGTAIVRLRGVWMDGRRVDADEYATDGALLRLHTPPRQDVALTLEAVLRHIIESRYLRPRPRQAAPWGRRLLTPDANGTLDNQRKRNVRWAYLSSKSRHGYRISRAGRVQGPWCVCASAPRRNIRASWCRARPPP